MKNKFLLATLALIAILFLIVFPGYLFDWSWTGLTGYLTDSNTFIPRHKTLWDWLELLLIPMILAVGGYWFQQTTKAAEQEAAEKRASDDREAAEKRARDDREAAEKRASIDREIAADNFRATTLQTYLASMSDLLVEGRLLEAPEGSGPRTVARAMTITTLRRLDSVGKGSVIVFLSESRLITSTKGKNPFIDLDETDLANTELDYLNLSGANLFKTDLSGANLGLTTLSGANLIKATLSGANLSGASLFKADLCMAHLSGAGLNGADLSGADLRGADLTEAKLGGAIKLGGAKYDKNTIWPSAFPPPPDAVLL